MPSGFKYYFHIQIFEYSTTALNITLCLHTSNLMPKLADYTWEDRHLISLQNYVKS